MEEVFASDASIYLSGFEECSEKDWINCCEDGDRAMLEIDKGNSHEVIYFKKNDVYSEVSE